MIPETLRSYLAEPAIADPPARGWRDWALVGAASLAAILEATFRTDAEWVEFSVAWHAAAVVMFFLTMPAALLLRRTRPLLATIWGFAPTMAFGVTAAIVVGEFGGLMTTVVVLVMPYSLYRWGSGRDGAIGAAVLVSAGVIGNLADPSTTLGDWIGGFIVLSIPVEAGLIVRYRGSAHARQIAEAKAREREQLARELHDTVAHHVSAIAIQAQAGQAMAASDPERAIGVLPVIENAASTTLSDMRAIVGALRTGTDAALAPQQGVSDLQRLANASAGGLHVEVDMRSFDGDLAPVVDTAVFRIAQESITNSIRHARRATRVDVCVSSDAETVRVTITDDGDGGDAAHAQGYGLLGMAERAHLLGGDFEAGPVQPRGWRVVAEFPRDAVPT